MSQELRRFQLVLVVSLTMLPLAVFLQTNDSDNSNKFTFNVTTFNISSINGTWIKPIDTHTCEHTTDQEVIRFQVWYKPTKEKEFLSFNLSGNASYAEITSLRAGTEYSIYVTAYFHSQCTLNSGIVTKITAGYGPDRACECDEDGVITDLELPCDNVTGRCYCQYPYAGHHCDECQSEFARMTRNSPCERCPCPGECRVTKEQGGPMFECICLKGYTGLYCHECDNNYYHVDGSCKECQCSGNNPKENIKCDIKTGQCLNCQYFTTGVHCDRCLPGYEGDPVFAKNCTEIKSLGSKTKSIVIGVCTAAAVVVLGVVLYFGIKKYRSWRLRRPGQFWTVELKDDHENVSFSSMLDQGYHDDHDMLDEGAAYQPTTQSKLTISHSDGEKEKPAAETSAMNFNYRQM